MKLVHVIWLDAVSDDKPGWKPRKKIRKQKPARIESVGWVLRKTKHHLTLVSSIDKRDCDGDTTIPRGMVLKVRRLK